MAKTVRDKIIQAVQALESERPYGVETFEIYDYLNKHFPREDGRTWKGNMAIPGDYAVWADNGEVVNASADDDPACPKLLVKVSARGENPGRFRLRRG